MGYGAGRGGGGGGEGGLTSSKIAAIQLQI